MPDTRGLIPPIKKHLPHIETLSHLEQEQSFDWGEIKEIAMDFYGALCDNFGDDCLDDAPTPYVSIFNALEELWQERVQVLYGTRGAITNYNRALEKLKASVAEMHN